MSGMSGLDQFCIYTQLQNKGIPLKLSRERRDPDARPMSLQEMEARAIRLRPTSWDHLLKEDE